MALDQNAGKKRTVGMARNLLPAIEASTPSDPVTVASALVSNPNPSVLEPQTVREAPVIATQSGRNRKISFLTHKELEERFRKCRLKGGFDTLEDAYNEAIKRFCDQVETGQIDNF